MLLAFLLPVFFLTQLVTSILVYSETRKQITERNHEALFTTKENFRKYLDATRSSLSRSAQILAADFGFRSAVASKDPRTISSALENLSKRVDVRHASLVDASGSVLADLGGDFKGRLSSAAEQLLKQSQLEGQANGLILSNGHVYQLVVVPVLAPNPIGWIFIGNPIDKNTTDALREQSTLRLDIAFVSQDKSGSAHYTASSFSDEKSASVLRSLNNEMGVRHPSGTEEKVIEIGGESHITLVEDLHAVSGSEPIFMVVMASIHEALKPYDSLFRFLACVAALGFVITVFFAIAIARKMTRPLSAMVDAANKYRAGDYSEKLAEEGPTELVALANSLNVMSDEIAEREQRIFETANYDNATRLANRAKALYDINEYETKSEHDVSLVAALLRLENVSDIRMTIGQDMASQFVAKVVERLNFLASDDETLYRLNEGALLYIGWEPNGFDQNKFISSVATALDLPVSLDGVDIDPQFHLGFAGCSKECNARTLIRQAELAAEQAAERGLLHETYDRDYDEYMAERLSLMADMRRAVENNEMMLCYQPKVDFESNKVSQVEALLRWQDSERGVVSPEIFIPLAERTGYIKAITRWVIERAMQDCRAWRQQGHQVKVAINLSARDLVEEGFANYIKSQLAANGLDKNAVAFEITESAVIESRDKAIALIEKLREFGLDIAIDDFGTGESSMSYLKELPATELKIDKSFITAIAQNPADQIIVRSAIELGHRLGMKVTAEGIEDIATESLLKDFACDYGQGWLYAKPLSLEKLIELLKKSDTFEIYSKDNVRSLPLN